MAGSYSHIGMCAWIGQKSGCRIGVLSPPAISGPMSSTRRLCGRLCHAALCRTLSCGKLLSTRLTRGRGYGSGAGLYPTTEGCFPPRACPGESRCWGPSPIARAGKIKIKNLEGEWPSGTLGWPSPTLPAHGWPCGHLAPFHPNPLKTHTFRDGHNNAIPARCARQSCE